jgi:hypothetical protein
VLTVWGAMKGESRTAPVRPPPSPVIPGRGLLGPGPSPQHADESLWSPSDSSKLMTRRPSRLNAGEAVILGTQVDRNVSMSARAEMPDGWLTQG